MHVYESGDYLSFERCLHGSAHFECVGDNDSNDCLAKWTSGFRKWDHLPHPGLEPGLMVLGAPP